MCGHKKRRNSCCERLDHLKGKPQNCTPERVRECHGEKQDHTCAPQRGKA